MGRVLITLLAIASLAVLAVALVWQRDHPPGLSLEIAKAALNILTVAVIAQLASTVVADAAERRKTSAANDEFRKETLNRLTAAFVGTKSVRRLMRSQLDGVEESGDLARATLPKRAYMKMMRDINEIQLNLEALAKDVETSHDVFNQAREIFLGTTQMEEYLNRLVDEWEDRAAHFAGTPPRASLDKLPQVRDMLGEYKSSLFRPNFVHAYYATAELVRKSMTKPATMSWKKGAHPLPIATGGASGPAPAAQPNAPNDQTNATV